MSDNLSEIITEITPNTGTGYIYAVKREKPSFNFPIHKHEEYEINFLSGCKGALRIVGDNVSELGDYDLVMLGHGIPHGWMQHNCRSQKINEITIQLSPKAFDFEYIKNTHLYAMLKLLNQCANGISFGMDTILEAYHQLNGITRITDPLEKIFAVMRLVNILAESQDYTLLASDTFSESLRTNESRRITKVQKYINEHYNEKINLAGLAGMVGMSESAFSRFFKQHTGRTVSEFILEMKLGAASRLLINTSRSVSEICYECGFNNLSHFSRCFRGNKGCTPSEFRAMYDKQGAE